MISVRNWIDQQKIPGRKLPPQWHPEWEFLLLSLITTDDKRQPIVLSQRQDSCISQLLSGKHPNRNWGLHSKEELTVTQLWFLLTCLPTSGPLLRFCFLSQQWLTPGIRTRTKTWHQVSDFGRINISLYNKLAHVKPHDQLWHLLHVKSGRVLEVTRMYVYWDSRAIYWGK